MPLNHFPGNIYGKADLNESVLLFNPKYTFRYQCKYKEGLGKSNTMNVGS